MNTEVRTVFDTIKQSVTSQPQLESFQALSEIALKGIPLER